MERNQDSQWESTDDPRNAQTECP